MSERCVIKQHPTEAYVIHNYYYNHFDHDINNARIFETVKGAKQFIATRKRKGNGDLHWFQLPKDEVLEVIPIEVWESEERSDESPGKES